MGVRVGPCSVEGETVACHAIVGERGGVIDCFNGSQVCTSGQWGPCDGNGPGGGTLSTRSVGASLAGGGGLRINSLSTADAGAFSCATNPCNPFCIGYDETPGTPIVGTSCGSSSVTQVSASMCQISTTYWSDNAIGCTAASTDDCFFGDTCCVKQTAPACGYTNSTKNYCIARRDAACGANPGCAAKVDYTAAPACDTPDGHSHISLCNRGGVAAPTAAGTKLWLTLFNSSDFRKECGGCGPGAADDKFAAKRGHCSLDLSVNPLAAGACYDFDLTAAIAGTGPAGTSCTMLPTKNLTGAWGVYVNSAQSGGTFSATCAGKGLAECNDCNNWSAMDIGHPACPASGSTGTPVSTQTYAASCPPGTSVRWGLLGYSASVTAPSTVSFSVQTGPASSGPWTPATAVTVATAPTDHPATCTMAGPSPSCPVDLYSSLAASSGGVASTRAAYLNLTATLTTAASTCANTGSPQADICGLPGGCNGPKAGAQKEPCTANSDCNYDTCCPSAGASACVAWPTAPATYNCGGCSGSPDYTVGVGCTSGGKQIFSVCNRSTDTDSPATGSLKLGWFTDNPVQSKCAPQPTSYIDKGYCTIDLSVIKIKKGGCARIDTDTPSAGVNCGAPGNANMSGNRAVFINYDNGLPECNLCNNTSFNNGGTCAPYNGGSGTPPALNSWQVTYSCVPSE